MDREKRELANLHSNAIADSVEAGKIQSLIYVIRGKQVMLDSDLAMLYQVETKNLNKAMKRNLSRFPEDFCFQLTTEEYVSLRFQNGTSNDNQNEKGGRMSVLELCGHL